ncbi:MAG TPA: hypothetical protein VHJ83_02510 [Micromonosporaceae bacterium]|jgi:preprotein translocase subunit Sss1|nr:hypothetical protein [Micromonosporaceae bacterium]
MSLSRIENEMATASDRSAGSRTAGFVVFGVGAALVVLAAWLLDLATAYTFTGPPTCDGEAMNPGDACLAFGTGSGYDYEEGIRIQQSFGTTVRALGGVLLGGVAAWMLSSGARVAGMRNRAASRGLYAVAAVLLGAVAGYLFTLDAIPATLGAVGAAAATVRMIVGIDWKPLSTMAVYLAGLSALGVAGYLVGLAATYRPGPLYGSGWDTSVDMLVADIVNGQGGWLRLVLAGVATVGGWWLITDAAEPEPDSRARIGRPSRWMTLAAYVGAVLAAVGVAGYLIRIDTLSARVALGLAALLVVAFGFRAVRAVTNSR